MKKKMAAFVSFLFNPSFTFPLLLLLVILKAHLTPDQEKLVLPLIFFLDLVIPAFLWTIFRKKDWISDWEMTKRLERINFYLILSALFFLGTMVVYFFGNSLAGHLYLIFSLAFFLATLITVFWKISIHMLVDTLFVNILNFLFPGFWFFYLFLPPIAWSRYVRHKHTPAQLLGGFLLSFLVFWAGWFFLLRS